MAGPPAVCSPSKNLRDQMPSMFRAVGKILYSKREPKNASQPDRIPQLTFDPEELVEQTGLSHDDFVGYLHENSLKLYSGCSGGGSGGNEVFDHLVAMLAEIGQADLLLKVDTRLYENRRSVSSFGSSLASRFHFANFFQLGMKPRLFRSVAFHGHFCVESGGARFSQITKPTPGSNRQFLEETLRQARLSWNQFCAGCSASFILDQLAFAYPLLPDTCALKQLAAFKLKRSRCESGLFITMLFFTFKLSVVASALSRIRVRSAKQLVELEKEETLGPSEDEDFLVAIDQYDD